MLGAALHFLTDAYDPVGVVAALAAALAPGSFVAISHLTSDFAPEAVTAGVAAYNALVPAGITARSHARWRAPPPTLTWAAPGRRRGSDAERAALALLEWCGFCWAAPGTACTSQGHHLARYFRAFWRGLISREDVAWVCRPLPLVSAGQVVTAPSWRAPGRLPGRAGTPAGNWGVRRGRGRTRGCRR